MEPALFAALEAVALVVLVVLVFRASHRFELVARVRLSVCFSGLLLALLLLEQQLSLPAHEAVSTAVVALLILFALHIFLQVADHLVWERFFKPRHIPVPRLLFDIVNFLVLAGVGLGLLKTLYAVNLTGFLVTSTVLSAILGLSLQDVLTSVMSGIALQIESPIAVREWIRVGEKEGEVVQMNWRTVTLRTREGHHVVLPNSRVAREDLVNYSRPGALELISVTVGVAYDQPPGEVKRVLEAALAGTEGVCDSPRAQVLVKCFGESAIDYDVRFWVLDVAKAPQLRDAVLSRVWYALRRAGMGIPLPQREVAVRHVPESEDDQRVERLRKESFEVLRSVETFRPLSDVQVQFLARSARMERYAAGELLVRQGDEGRSLFVVKSGEVRVEHKDGDALTREIARLGPGSFFGEMSLLTGEPRTASVVACGEVEVTVVDKVEVGAVILADKHLAVALSEALEHRSREMSRLAAAFDRQESSIVDDSGSFFVKIQRFFGLEG